MCSHTGMLGAAVVVALLGRAAELGLGTDDLKAIRRVEGLV